MFVKVPQMQSCSWCLGYGLVHCGEGDVETCSHCGCSGIEEARDERGRFLPWLVIEMDDHGEKG